MLSKYGVNEAGKMFMHGQGSTGTTTKVVPSHLKWS